MARPRMHTVLIQGGEGGPFAECHPPALTLWVGDHVRWKNNDHLLMDHSAASVDGESEVFDTGAIPPGAMSEAIAFARAGVYAYRCRLHVSTSPVGTLEVLPRTEP